MNNDRDEYLESLYLEKELHQLTIANSAKFRPEVAKRAKAMLKECEERITLYTINHRRE